MKLENMSKRPLLYVMDCFVTSCLLTIFFMDLFIFKGKIGNDCDALKLEPVLITILLPTTVTIVSLSLSLSKDKTYGVTLNELNLLRGPLYFDFLHIVFIVCGIFAFCTLLYAFGAIITIYVLMAISLIYSVIFLWQQIPLLIKHEDALKKIMMAQYNKVKARGNLFEAKGYKAKREENIYIKLVQGILFVDGIEMAYDLLEDSDDERHVLTHLLQIQNIYLIHFQTGLPSGYIPEPAKDGDFSIYEAIGKGYHNIIWLLSQDKDLGGYHLIRTSLLCLHSICKQTRMQNKEKEEMNTLVSLFLSTYPTGSGRQKNIKTVFATMCAFTIQRGETWFLEFLRDNNLSPVYMFRFGECSFGFFVSMMIVHALNSPFLKDNEKDRLLAFGESHFNGINSNDQIWRSMVEDVLQDCDPVDVVKSLCDLLGNIDAVASEDLLFLGNANTVEYSPDTDYFDGSAIIGYWLEMALYASSCYAGSCHFEEALNLLSEAQRKAVFDCFLTKWLDRGKQKSNVSLPFLNAFVKTSEMNLANNLYSCDLFSSLALLCEAK